MSNFLTMFYQHFDYIFITIKNFQNVGETLLRN